MTVERAATVRHGDVIIRADIVGTLVFTATATAATVIFTSGVQWVAAVTAIVLFFTGIAAFLWSFYNAVQRSRTEQVAVTQLYLLAGGVAPRPVRRVMLSLLAVQIVVGLVTALGRPNSADGSPGSSLALGVLVPMFGLGMNGLWAAYHGTYTSRAADPSVGASHGVRTSTGPIDKNEEHG